MVLAEQIAQWHYDDTVKPCLKCISGGSCTCTLFHNATHASPGLRDVPSGWMQDCMEDSLHTLENKE